MHDTNQGTQAQHVGKQDEFLAQRGAGLADRGHELDALQPLFRGQLDVTGKGVQMPHRRVHDLFHPRVRGVRHLPQRFVGDGQFVEVNHYTLPLVLSAAA